MNDTQILVLSLSVVIPLSMLLFSNSRISDTKESLNKRMDSLESSLNKRMDDTKDSLNKRMDSLEANIKEHIDNAFQHMELLLKIHESEHHNGKGGK